MQDPTFLCESGARERALRLSMELRTYTPDAKSSSLTSSLHPDPGDDLVGVWALRQILNCDLEWKTDGNGEASRYLPIFLQVGLRLGVVAQKLLP